MISIIPVKNHSSTNFINNKHLSECTEKRGIKNEWIEVNCRTVNAREASEQLGYTAKSGGLLLTGAGFQEQLKPDEPWPSPGSQKSPKYRSCKDEDGFDAMIPNHPYISNYWDNLEDLKSQSYHVDGHPCLVVTEGFFKAIALTSHGIPTIALLGVEMGLTAAKNDPQGKRYLVKTLERFAKAGFGFVIGFDADCASNPRVIKAEEKLAHQLSLFNVPVYSITGLWKEVEGKGIDDYIQMNGFEQFRDEVLARAVNKFNKQISSSSDAGESKPKTKKKSPKDVADELAEDYRPKWKWHEDQKLWRAWNGKFWQRLKDGEVDSLIKSTVDARGEKYETYSFLENVQKLLRCDLRESYWNYKDRSKYVAFNNCIVEIETGKVLDHEPGHMFTAVLPYDYRRANTAETDLIKLLAEKCPTIYSFFEFSQYGDRVKMLRLIALISALIKWKFHSLQKFIHIMGKPGTGKGTFARLLQKIVGRENWSGATLKALNNDGSTIAKVIDKQLVVCPDERKTGAIDIILSLTGGDSISYREVYKGAADSFFYGLLMIISNAPIFVGDCTGLDRRLILLDFDRQFPERDSGVEDLMESEISDLVAIALQMSDTDAKTLLCRQEVGTTIKKWEQILETNSVAAWIDANCVIDKNATELTQGLYNNYAEFCNGAGLQKLSLTKFPRYLLELSDFLTANFRRDTSGRDSKIIGLRLRTGYDEDVPTISASLFPIQSAPLTGIMQDLIAPLEAIQGKDLTTLHHLNPETSEKTEILKSDPLSENPLLDISPDNPPMKEIVVEVMQNGVNADEIKPQVVQSSPASQDEEAIAQAQKGQTFKVVEPGSPALGQSGTFTGEFDGKRLVLTGWWGAKEPKERAFPPSWLELIK